jgi:hypothetical protein
MAGSQDAGFDISFGENPFAEGDARYATWEEFSAAKRKQVTHLISGLRDLQHVGDEATYADWRVRHPEAPEAYNPDQVASWLGKEGAMLIRERFDTIAAEAFTSFIRSPDDLRHAERIIANLTAAMSLTFGDHGEWLAFDFDGWKEWKLEFVKDFIENINLPPRRWRIDPYDRDRAQEKHLTPLIVRVMRVLGVEFEHVRQTVDACLDLLCKEGLAEDERNIVLLGAALITLCERLEIEALSNHRQDEATLFAKFQIQFKKLLDDGFGECAAVMLLLTKSQGAPKPVPTITGGFDAKAIKQSRANTVARIVTELNNLKPQMIEDEGEYEQLRGQYSNFLVFKIAEQRHDLKMKILAIRGSTRHIRLAQELAAAYHGRELSTIQDDWKDHKPSEFKRRK